MVDDMTTPDGKTNTMPGEIYTMLSRAKSMEVLHRNPENSDGI
jgi:hypothetical protein